MNTKEPSPEFMNAYMKHFVNQSNNLAKDGAEITDENGLPIKLTIVPLCCPCDSVARPVLQNRFQYSSYCSCSWCYEYGLYENHAVRYPIRKEDSVLRTNKSHRKDYKDKKKHPLKDVKGVKGFSILLTLLTFDMVWGFPIDYLHADLLGVVKYVWDVMIKTKVIAKGRISKINDKLANMTPPHEIHRLPRSLKQKSMWKASEWRAWLLFYSVVCLRGLVDDPVLEHYQLLVDSLFILLQESISKEDLRICEEKLVVFVSQYQETYGIGSMTFNIHSLIHLVKSVRCSGPLWATSTFCFKSAIFYLQQAMTGPKGRYDQIAKRTLQRLSFNETCRKLATTESSKSYCAKLFTHPENKNAIQASDNVLLIGPIGSNEDGSHLFNRCVYKSKVFHSVKYGRPSKTNDTMVLLFTEEIGEIQQFQVEQEGTHVLINLFTEVQDNLLKVRHIRRVIRTDKFLKVPITLIHEKLIFMAPGDNFTYISRLPNTIEIQ